MAIDQLEFGKNLNSERKRLRFKLYEMAEACGVAPGTQYLYEKGDRLPNADYINFAIGLGINSELLLPNLAGKKSVSTEAILNAVAKAEEDIAPIRIAKIQNELNNELQSLSMKAS